MGHEFVGDWYSMAPGHVNGDFLALFITKNSREQVIVPRWRLFEFVTFKFVKCWLLKQGKIKQDKSAKVTITKKAEV